MSNAILHLFSAFLIAVVGGGVCLWAFLTPRIRWDRFWIGLVLVLVVAPIAVIVTLARMGNSSQRMNALDGEIEREPVVVDTTAWVDPAMDPVVVDTTAWAPR